jgi:TatD DNase family protein
MLVDTHCHLDAAEFAADRDAVIEAAKAAGVALVVVPAVERAGFPRIEELCLQHACCFPAYGIHPLYVDRALPEDLQVLRATLAGHTAVAVGEIGLDFYVDGFDREGQEFYFCEQLKIARDFDLPVILHVRRAIDAVLKQLRRFKVKGGIAHAFNGSRQQADEFIKLGFRLGFGGAMTYERALRLRALAQTLPLEAIVLETDSPDIPPAWIGKGRNTPAELPRIAEMLAHLRGESVEHVICQTGRNAREVLPGLAATGIDA